jgi:hypothetical protein
VVAHQTSRCPHEDESTTLKVVSLHDLLLFA